MTVCVSVSVCLCVCICLFVAVCLGVYVYLCVSLYVYVFLGGVQYFNISEFYKKIKIIHIVKETIFSSMASQKKYPFSFYYMSDFMVRRDIQEHTNCNPRSFSNFIYGVLQSNPSEVSLLSLEHPQPPFLYHF